jgi:hypothetical protein
MEEKPLITVILIADMGKLFLQRILEALSAEELLSWKLEILLMDHGTKDSSVEFVRENYPAVKILKVETQDPVQVSRLGIERAQGAMIALGREILITGIDRSKEVPKAGELTEDKEALAGELARVRDILPLRENLIRTLHGELSQVDASLREKEQLLSEKEDVIARQGRLISEKEKDLCDKTSEVHSLHFRIEQIHGSRTYRYIAKPVWRTLALLRTLREKCRCFLAGGNKPQGR